MLQRNETFLELQAPSMHFIISDENSLLIRFLLTTQLGEIISGSWNKGVTHQHEVLWPGAWDDPAVP